jgi:hypothetical protein
VSLGLPETGRWIAKPQRARWGLQRLAPGGFILSNALFVLGVARKSFALAWLGIVLVVAIAGWLVYAVVSELAARRTQDADRALMDGAFGEQFSVELTIFVNGNAIGADRGVVWFADGLMGFSGTSASFVLAASDLVPQWGKAKGMSHDAIVLVGAPRRTHVVIAPVFGQTRAYRERLAQFMKAKAIPEGERHWPPLERYVEEPPILEPVVRR